MPGVGLLHDCEGFMSFSISHLKCQRCGADVPVPDLSVAARKSVAAIAHQVGRLQAILELRSSTRLGLGDAKFIASHISGVDRVCHRCGTRLTEELGEQACPKCRSLNLIW